MYPLLSPYDDPWPKEWTRLKSRGLLPVISKGMSFMKAATCVSSHTSTLFSSSSHCSSSHNNPSVRYVPAPTSTSSLAEFSIHNSGHRLTPLESETTIGGEDDQNNHVHNIGIDSGTHSPTMGSGANNSNANTNVTGTLFKDLPSTLVSAAATSKSKKVSLSVSFYALVKYGFPCSLTMCKWISPLFSSNAYDLGAATIFYTRLHV